MKTTVIMKRVLGDHMVRQSSKDSMFNANDLLSIYNKNLDGEKKKKNLQDYMKLKTTKDMKEAILKRLNHDHENSPVLPDNIIRTSKGMKTEKGGTWMHPYLFIDFAMWLSVDFKIMCIEWIYDHLIELRNQVGDEYKELTSAIKNILQPTNIDVYKDEINMINKLVFGNMDHGNRQLATKQQLDLLQRLQKADIKLLEEGKNFMERFHSLYRLKQLIS